VVACYLRAQHWLSETDDSKDGNGDEDDGNVDVEHDHDNHDNDDTHDDNRN
jgi:hypothetical protein